jgi:hypothetical protein
MIAFVSRIGGSPSKDAVSTQKILCESRLCKTKIECRAKSLGGVGSQYWWQVLSMSLRQSVPLQTRFLTGTSVSTDDCRSAFQSTVKFVSVGKTVKETMCSAHVLWT